MVHKKQLLFVITFYSFVFLFFSCVSPKRMFATGDLCGVIVDENSKPVSDFLIVCSNNGTFRESTITNNSGIFTFPAINTGIYYLQGEKENYGKIEKLEYTFNDSSSMFCCQISSIDDVLEKVNLLINVNEYEKGVELLDSILIKKDRQSEEIILAYKAYLFNMLGDESDYKKCISHLKKTKNKKSLDFIQLMEKKNYEKN